MSPSILVSQVLSLISAALFAAVSAALLMISSKCFSSCLSFLEAILSSSLLLGDLVWLLPWPSQVQLALLHPQPSQKAPLGWLWVAI
eukprot:7428100-Heterocapsa_arctica.AAC.1